MTTCGRMDDPTSDPPSQGEGDERLSDEVRDPATTTGGATAATESAVSQQLMEAGAASGVRGDAIEADPKKKEDASTTPSVEARREGADAGGSSDEGEDEQVKERLDMFARGKGKSGLSRVPTRTFVTGCSCRLLLLALSQGASEPVLRRVSAFLPQEVPSSQLPV